MEANGSGLQAQQAGGASELIGVAIALVVLVLTFGSLVAAGLPLLTALVGVGIGTLSISAMTAFTDISSSTTGLATMIGLAVGIDYALFILARYRSELEVLGEDRRAEAVGRAVGTAGSAVTFAGLTVIIALAALAVVRIPFMTAMGLGAAATVLVAVLVALTLLPALLGTVQVQGLRRPGAPLRSASRRRWARPQQRGALGPDGGPSPGDHPAGGGRRARRPGHPRQGPAPRAAERQHGLLRHHGPQGGRPGHRLVRTGPPGSPAGRRRRTRRPGGGPCGGVRPGHRLGQRPGRRRQRPGGRLERRRHRRPDHGHPAVRRGRRQDRGPAHRDAQRAERDRGHHRHDDGSDRADRHRERRVRATRLRPADLPGSGHRVGVPAADRSCSAPSSCR